MEGKEIKALQERINKLQKEKEQADQMRMLKLKEAKYKLSSRLSNTAAKHPFLSFPFIQAKRAATNFTFPHFSEETKRKFRDVASKLHNHMVRVASNRAFAERLAEGQTALNPQTGDLLTKTKEVGKGYIITKRVRVRV
jgi:hypothetical protein